ncbi:MULTISPECIES: HPr kinase/phosphatase C-terminal domain-containing protein [unclassified Yoonia]|uniref:HPr kinase/phosphorylase n=1 Tax=unclassified Yoonia TaxID=2629118 RepID=UPI002AFF2A1E|nr:MULTISPECIES: HPr kinase/phosphatase C-terminal domain-containing protein [unclassified Yoonia]
MPDAQTLHGTCVAWGDDAALIIGASGRGKSALALQLMALGCVLVADDRVIVQADGARLRASCPPTIVGLIEAWGAGILRAPPRAQAHIALVVDLDHDTTGRMPDRRLTRVAGCDIPLINRISGPHFAATILQILKSGWSDR